MLGKKKDIIEHFQAYTNNSRKVARPLTSQSFAETARAPVTLCGGVIIRIGRKGTCIKYSTVVASSAQVVSGPVGEKNTKIVVSRRATQGAEWTKRKKEKKNPEKKKKRKKNHETRNGYLDDKQSYLRCISYNTGAVGKRRGNGRSRTHRGTALVAVNWLLNEN